MDYIGDSFNLILTAVLIILNGFFVAAEFALVKVSKSKIKGMQRDNRPFADIAMWLYKRQSMALSACQMGITMASLALGWIGEPALAHLVRPLLESLGITSDAVLHGVAFTIAFTLITSLHIVIGEQFPKIYAIRKPIPVVGWTAYPLKVFYVLFFPFMWLLDRTTASLLRMVGIESSGEHETVLSEEEIRASLSIAHNMGDLSKLEHELLDAAFRFDDLVARQIMLPRADVDFFDLDKDIAYNMNLAQETRHTRFPLCDGSLDKIVGVVHIKDFVGVIPKDVNALKALARKPVFVQDFLPIHQLLEAFQKSKQHFAFVEDEYGNVIGIATLEQVLEQLVGSVQDEFDIEEPSIIKESERVYLIDGSTLIEEINDSLGTNLKIQDAETLSGRLTEKHGHLPSVGQQITLTGGVEAEVVLIKNRRVLKVKLTLPDSSETEP